MLLTLKRTEFSYYSALTNRRFIICTPAHSGQLGEGAQGDGQKTKSLKPHKIFSLAPLINFKTLFLGLFWIGSLLSLFSPAKAAENLTANLDLKKVVENIYPSVITEQASVQEPLALTAAGYLAKPLVAETQITREEKIIKAVRQRQNTPVKSRAKLVKTAPVGFSAGFPYGYCTYYVAQKRLIPWSGNAITWLSGARSFGFATGDSPKVGAIVVTSEGGRAGHVAMVDAVGDGTITVSEMNFMGFGVISSRTISSSYSRIMGYIY